MTVTRAATNLDIDRDGRSDGSEIGQNPGYVGYKNETLYLHTDVVVGSPILATNSSGNKQWTQKRFEKLVIKLRWMEAL